MSSASRAKEARPPARQPHASDLHVRRHYAPAFEAQVDAVLLVLGRHAAHVPAQQDAETRDATPEERSTS